MAAPRLLSRFLTTTTSKSSPALLYRVFSTTSTFTSTATASTSLPRFSLFRPLSSAIRLRPSPTSSSFSRTLATRRQQSDDSHNSTRPPKETILLDGCDFEHWLVVVDPPPQDWTRDQIIDHYIKTLAKVLGSEEEARMKIYSVSTRHYFAFGALVSEELSYKLKEMEGIRWVLPDSYLDVKNKDYGGEPFIDGQAVPYDPKYHEEWVRNNQKAMERNRRNDRPRNNDRSRNFERRQRPQGFQNNPNPGGNMSGTPNQIGAPYNAGYAQNVTPNSAGYAQNVAPNNAGYAQNVAPNNAGYAQNMQPYNAGNAQNMQPYNAGYPPNMQPNNAGYAQNIQPNNPGYQRMSPPNADYPQSMPQNNPGFAHNAPPNMSGPPSSFSGQGNPVYPNAVPVIQGGGGMPYQNNTQTGSQLNYPAQNNMGGGSYQSQNVPGRDPHQ